MTLEEMIKRYEKHSECIHQTMISKEEAESVCEWLRELKAYRKAMKEVNEYASIWTSYDENMSKKEIAHNSLQDAKDGFLAIVDRHLKGVKADE